MKITEGVVESFDVIRGNKARSFLTILGINFGVGCLIAISVIGLAFRESVGSEVGRYGTTMLWVQPNWEAYASRENRTLLEERDIEYFTTNLPGMTDGSSIFDESCKVSFQGKSVKTQAFGVDPGHFRMFDVKIASGRLFMDHDVDARSPVCVIRPDLASRLFEGIDPIGKSIRAGDRNYTVIGVTERYEQGMLSDGSDNNTVFVPSHFIAKKQWGGMSIKYWVYLLQFDTVENVNLAEERMSDYLLNKYGSLRGEPRFRIQRLDSFVDMVDNILNIINSLVLVIASISIVVGGLGIMNIMLVAVSERTKEIGLRMAVGATRKDIVIQFIIEAITLCLIGGGTGVIFGSAIAALACTILKWKFMLSLATVAGAMGISTAIGMLFGIYPAWKASKLLPVEALRADH